jgi:hypothetical protein
LSPFELERELDKRARIISEKNNDILVLCVEINPNKYYPISTDPKYSKKHKMLYSETEKHDELSEKM